MDSISGQSNKLEIESSELELLEIKLVLNVALLIIWFRFYSYFFKKTQGSLSNIYDSINEEEWINIVSFSYIYNNFTTNAS